MLFQTTRFLIFFLIVFTGFLLLNHKPKLRSYWILVASWVFYSMAGWKFLGLLLFVTCLDFGLGLLINSSKSERRRKIYLILSVVSNLTILGTFKYFNFFVHTFEGLCRHLGWESSLPVLSVALPVGISFYTFESMSYIIDIYRRKIEPCRKFHEYALFISFFPHLVAGPIIRPATFFPAIREPLPISKKLFNEGLFRFALGIFKKFLIADLLASDWVDEVFSTPHNYAGLDTLIAVYGYAFQIYFDFSGYSDMAIGLSRMLGIELPENFNSPYIATNFQDFWRRWHISLSSWLRDYLYIPLGGSRKGTLARYKNVFITMLLGGLWHGANWNFVIWGALHGVFICIAQLKQDFYNHARDAAGHVASAWGKFAGWFITFHGVCLAWIFFRSTSEGNASQMIKTVLNPLSYRVGYSGPRHVVFVLLLCFAATGLALFNFKPKLQEYFSRSNLVLRVCVTAVAVILILVFQHSFKPFIYFQF
jgi:alginate O-acetyltransferase complex protein AlgI